MACCMDQEVPVQEHWKSRTDYGALLSSQAQTPEVHVRGLTIGKTGQANDSLSWSSRPAAREPPPVSTIL